ncbi:type II toxin-antitoxin system HicB family antitoxin [bacterium]|nr:type II toxin-antitoxin system HicB family antitoxin [bacterium]
MKKYLVILERAKHNWAAHSPDVPGCVATGKTREETKKNFQEALEFHFEGLREDGLPIPEPRTRALYVSVKD